MIRHKAESMDTMPVSFNPLLKELTKPGPICLGIKNILAVIATQNYMIKSARIMDTGFTGHIELSCQNVRMSSLTHKMTQKTCLLKD
jgi:hypothetical protein